MCDNVAFYLAEAKMSIGLWLTFLMAAFLISISPGAGAISTMNSGIRHGVKASLPTIMGLQLGYAVQILVVAVGLGALLTSSALAFLTIKWVGIAYLLWLGVQKWRSTDALHVTGSNSLTAKQQFCQSALVNLTNPKATVFLVALFPQFLSNYNASSYALQLCVMGATLILADVVVMFCYAALASQFKGWVNSPVRMQRMNRFFGSFFIVAALMLALYKKS